MHVDAPHASQDETASRPASHAVGRARRPVRSRVARLREERPIRQAHCECDAHSTTRRREPACRIGAGSAMGRAVANGGEGRAAPAPRDRSAVTSIERATDEHSPFGVRGPVHAERAHGGVAVPDGQGRSLADPRIRLSAAGASAARRSRLAATAATGGTDSRGTIIISATGANPMMNVERRGRALVLRPGGAEVGCMRPIVWVIGEKFEWRFGC